jgi:Holliday junction resolvase
LGISLADLGLRAVAKDESTRISLIDSLSDIVSAAGHDTGKVRLLADEIKQSPGLFEEIQEHRERREKVQRNQSLGAEVERLLREALEAHGMTVTRTGVGSDYEVEDDFIVDDEEVILTLEGPHRSLLVEVKATRGDAARMTVRQAEEAVANKDRFALSMVRLGDAEITAEAVRTQCRFIFNIGDQIGPVWAELSRYRKAKESVCTRVGDVELVVTDAEVRFAVGQGAWDAGLPLEAAVERIRGLLSCSASPTTAV